MRALCALVVALVAAAPVSAQTASPVAATSPVVSVGAFALIAEQQFAARTTFDAIFGSTSGPFRGGGAQVSLRNGLYVELAVSRFTKTGERAFLFNHEISRLGIPLTATITPVEVTGGYRLRLRRYPSLVPYVGAGFGSYRYKETSVSSDASENLDARHGGYIAVGGLEFKAQRWLALSVDAHYTHIPDIVGSGGISKEADEHDLGGTAVRLKVIVRR